MQLAFSTGEKIDHGSIKGKVYHYQDKWILSQEKTKIQQKPIFDVVDSNGVLFQMPLTLPAQTF